MPGPDSNNLRGDMEQQTLGVVDRGRSRREGRREKLRELRGRLGVFEQGLDNLAHSKKDEIVRLREELSGLKERINNARAAGVDEMDVLIEELNRRIEIVSKATQEERDVSQGVETIDLSSRERKGAVREVQVMFARLKGHFEVLSKLKNGRIDTEKYQKFDDLKSRFGGIGKMSDDEIRTLRGEMTSEVLELEQLISAERERVGSMDAGFIDAKELLEHSLRDIKTRVGILEGTVNNSDIMKQFKSGNQELKEEVEGMFRGLDNARGAVDDMILEADGLLWGEEAGKGTEDKIRELNKKVRDSIENIRQFTKNQSRESFSKNEKRKLKSLMENRDLLGSVESRMTNELGVSGFEELSDREKLLALLEEKVNQSRKDYAEKDYERSTILSRLKRTLEKRTLIRKGLDAAGVDFLEFGMGEFQKEVEASEEKYKNDRNEYLDAMIRFGDITDEKEVEKMLRYFMITEKVRQRGEMMNVEADRNPKIERVKKSMLDAADRFRQIRNIPRDEIVKITGSKLMGFGLATFATGVVVSDTGYVPVLKEFSTIVSAIGIKQVLEEYAKRKREKKVEKKLKKEAGKITSLEHAAQREKALRDHLKAINEDLTKGIKSEKKWRNFRTALAVGAGAGMYFGIGGSWIGDKIKEYISGIEVELDTEETGLMPPEPGYDPSKEPPFETYPEIIKTPEENLAELAKAPEHVEGSEVARDLPRIGEASSLNVANYFGLSPEEFSRLNDRTIDDIMNHPPMHMDSPEYRLAEFFEKTIEEGRIDFNGMDTLGEFFAEHGDEIRNISEMSDNDFEAYQDEFLSHEVVDFRKMVSENMRDWKLTESDLAGVTNRNALASNLYKEVIKLDSDYVSRPGEKFGSWLTRITLEAHENGHLSRVKTILRFLSEEGGAAAVAESAAEEDILEPRPLIP